MKNGVDNGGIRDVLLSGGADPCKDVCQEGTMRVSPQSFAEYYYKTNRQPETRKAMRNNLLKFKGNKNGNEECGSPSIVLTDDMVNYLKNPTDSAEEVIKKIEEWLDGGLDKNAVDLERCNMMNIVSDWVAGKGEAGKKKGAVLKFLSRKGIDPDNEC